MKMKKFIFTLFFIILVAHNTAINIQDYLYPNENINDIRHEAFSISGVEYELVFIKNEETFILKEDEIVNDSTEIETALKVYYTAKYYPAPADIADLTAYFVELNASRNNGEGMFGRVGEEQTCRDRVGGKLPKPPANYKEMYGDEYMYWATLMCSLWGHEINCNDPDMLYNHIKEFWIATMAVDERMNGTFNYLNNLSANNIYEGLLYMNESMPIIESNYNKMKNSILRFPLEGVSTCKTCFGICPPIVYNETAIAEIKLLLTQLIVQTKPLGAYVEISSSIANRTLERINYKTKEDLTGYYLRIYTPINVSAEDIINRSEESLGFVMNKTFAKKVDTAKALKIEIESSIALKNFDGMDEKINQFVELLGEVNGTIEPNKQWYYNAEREKDRVTGMIFLLESKDLSTEEVAQLSQYKIEKNNLDSGFMKGLEPSMYDEYSVKYIEIQEKMLPLMKSKEDAEVIKSAKAFAKNAGETTSNLILTVQNMPTSQRSEVLELLPTSLSLFSYLSLTSILVIVSLLLYLRINGMFASENQKTYYWIGVGMIGVILVLLSIGFYILLDRSLLKASFEDFSEVIAETDNIAVVVDYAGAPETAAVPMSNCAEKIINNLVAQNKTVVFYIYTDKCIINGIETNKNKKQCEDEISAPRIVLKYSNVQQNPSFSTVMDVKGKISGDEAYFNLCPISAVMGSEWHE